jgi:hypothetical protein
VRIDAIGERVDRLHADVRAGFGRLEKYLSGRAHRAKR